MKTLFTLFFATVLSVSLLGQQDFQELKDLQEERDARWHQTINTSFERENPRIHTYLTGNPSAQLRDLQGSLLKTGNVAKQKMDSIIYQVQDVATSTWVTTDRDHFTYDAQGHMTSYIWYAYDSDEMEILPYDKETVKYDQAGNATEIIWLIWDKEAGQWVNYGKFDISYDGNGNMTSQTIWDWDPGSSQWLEGVRSEMSYDESGNTLITLWYSWDEDSAKLVLSLKEEYLYEDGKLTTVNEYATEEGSLELYYRTLYSYDDSGNLVEELSQFYDAESGQWFDFYQTLFTYDENNRLILEEDWEFSWTAFRLAQVAQYEYAWDANGNMTESIERMWEDEVTKGTNAWVDVSKSLWSFNTDYSISELALPYWFLLEDSDIFFVHMPISEQVYIYDSESWQLDSRMTAYYSELGATGITSNSEAGLSIFPVPASENLTFSWEDSYAQLSLELFDLTGKQVISRNIDNRESIGVGQLSTGVYLYKLSDNKQLIHSGKISIR